MEEKSKKFKNTGSDIGVGTAIGAAIFAATNDPTWLAEVSHWEQLLAGVQKTKLTLYKLFI